jgi:2-(1,2-epoxy-1,2-dihydrophenyl)acetyl-CoA isomerase
MSPFLEVERRGAVAILRMDRPDAMNAIGSIEDCDCITDTFFDLGNDRSVSAIILTGKESSKNRALAD